MNTAKEEVQSLLSKLPDDCSLEDIQYHLYVIEKVRNGLEAAESQGTVSHEEVEQRFSKWLTR
jgi:predicted transcriptional regulator